MEVFRAFLIVIDRAIRIRRMPVLCVFWQYPAYAGMKSIDDGTFPLIPCGTHLAARMFCSNQLVEQEFQELDHLIGRNPSLQGMDSLTLL